MRGRFRGGERRKRCQATAVQKLQCGRFGVRRPDAALVGLGLFRAESDDDGAAELAFLEVDGLVLRVVVFDGGADVRGDLIAAAVAGEAGGHDGDRAVVAEFFGAIFGGEFLHDRLGRGGGIPSGEPFPEHGAIGGVGLVRGIAHAEGGAADGFDLREFLADPRGEREGFQAAVGDGGISCRGR